MVRYEALERHYRDRFVYIRAPTIFLTRSDTYTAHDTRQRQALADHIEGSCKFGFLDELNIPRDVEMNRAGIHAGSGQL